jgi:hypothetical protein
MTVNIYVAWFSTSASCKQCSSFAYYYKLAVPLLSSTLLHLQALTKPRCKHCLLPAVNFMLLNIASAPGNPNLPVYCGEIQGPGLGMDICALNDATNEPVIGEKGELVCRTPFPSMPTQFLNDPVSTYTCFNKLTFVVISVCSTLCKSVVAL